MKKFLNFLLVLLLPFSLSAAGTNVTVDPATGYLNFFVPAPKTKFFGVPAGWTVDFSQATILFPPNIGVTGPIGATNNGVATFNGTTGAAIKSTLLLVSSAGLVTGSGYTTAGVITNAGTTGAFSSIPLGGNGTYLGISGGVLGFYTPSGGGVPLILDNGTGSLPSRLSNSNFVMAQTDSTSNGAEGLSWGGTAYQFTGRATGGTRASPTATTNGLTFWAFRALGYDTGYLTGSSGQFQMRADGLWSTSNHGTYYEWTGTRNGATSASTWLTLQNEKLTTFTPSTVTAGFNLPHGATPTSPVNGDLWTTTAGIYAQVNGATVGPLTAGTFASPSGSVGLTAVPGAAGTYMRSDAAPALSQSIVPTWLNLHTFSAGIVSTFLRSTGVSITDAYAMPALAIDVTKGLNTKTVAGDSILTFSGTPAVSNTWFTIRLTNSDTNPHAIQIPSTFDSNRQQSNVTTFNILAGGVETITWCYDGTNYIGYNIPQSGSSAEVTIASATTTDLGAASSVNVAISGTTGISSFGTSPAGTYRNGRFTGVLTLTHNAASLFLPKGGSNITTAANDTFGAVSQGSGNWRVIWYQPATPTSGTGTVTASGGALTANALVLGAGTTDTKVAAGITSDGTSKLTLGVAGTSVGSIDFKNATSGTATIAPPTGALGTFQVTLPNAASTLPIFAQQITFAGPTAARTVTLPDASFTVARTDAANTFTGASTATSWTFTTPVFAGGNTASGSGANTWAGSTGTFITSSGANTLSGVTSITPAARSSGAAAFFTITTPADTSQTASTESIGVNKTAATRTWATTGTVALQREVFLAGPTYASASASQTFTDAFNLYLTPPVAGTNAIFTRGHTLGIVDATSASSPITGGLIVSTTLGTTATSVGIGGGNVNAGGTITAGGVVTASSTLELGNASDTTLARNAAGQISVEGGLVPTFVAQGTLSGTTPALTFTLSEKTDTITLSGNTTFSASGMTAGSKYTIFITCDGTGRTLSFPAWTWVEGAPSSIAASKEMRIDLYCKSTTAASVIAVYGVQP